LILLQNGTTEEVKKIVTTLNEAKVPGEDVVGESWLTSYGIVSFSAEHFILNTLLSMIYLA